MKPAFLKIKILFLISCLFSGTLLFGEPQNTATGEAREAYSRAIEFREKNQLMDAETELQKALELDPTNADYRFELANLYALRFDISRGKSKKNADYTMLDRAASQLEQVVMMKPDYLAAHYNLAIIYKRAGKYEKAREEFKKVLQLDPKQVNAIMQIGAVYEEQGFYDEAKSYYEQAKELDYGNDGIRSAIEDLGQHREESAQKEQAEFARRFRTRQNNLVNSMDPRTTNYNQFQEMNRDGIDPQQAGGIAQALPYLGSMIMDQFMKGRGEDQD